jgi:hypothetical protein
MSARQVLVGIGYGILIGCALAAVMYTALLKALA